MKGEFWRKSRLQNEIVIFLLKRVGVVVVEAVAVVVMVVVLVVVGTSRGGYGGREGSRVCSTVVC